MLSATSYSLMHFELHERVSGYHIVINKQQYEVAKFYKKC